MKKIAQFHQPDKPSSKHLVLAIDVSSRLLDLYSRYRQLFADWRQSGDLTWGPTGLAIQELYGFDPWKITKDTFSGYIAKMRAHQKGLHQRCLASIWQQAQSSCQAPLSPIQSEAISGQLEYFWQTWNLHLSRKDKLGQKIIDVVDRFDPGHWIPPLMSGFTEVTRAKILAEIGPLEQFPHWRALLAYAGLKVRIRSSGKYRGQDKITKKGRVLLRKHLGQAAWVLARKDRILGPYYHCKLSEGMPARKAKVACMRKRVKLLYGAAKSNQQFNPERVYRSAG
ncbi:MAG: IS110 family transposase [Balneolales bacterium]